MIWDERFRLRMRSSVDGWIMKKVWPRWLTTSPPSSCPINSSCLKMPRWVSRRWPGARRTIKCLLSRPVLISWTTSPARATATCFILPPLDEVALYLPVVHYSPLCPHGDWNDQRQAGRLHRRRARDDRPRQAYPEPQGLPGGGRHGGAGRPGSDPGAKAGPGAARPDDARHGRLGGLSKDEGRRRDQVDPGHRRHRQGAEHRQGVGPAHR